MELAQKILDITGSNSKIVYLPLPEDDPAQRRPDITLARKMLKGWEPVVPLHEGLVKTIRYFEELLMKEGKS
jgi:UDP-glucuronate decarboxylase